MSNVVRITYSTAYGPQRATYVRLAHAAGPRYVELAHVLDRMASQGGSFASSLARAWQSADSENSMRLEQTFPHLLDRYARACDAGQIHTQAQVAL